MVYNPSGDEVGADEVVEFPPVWVVEIKHTQSFSVRPPHEPGKDAAKTPANTHHIIQAVHRALAHGAPVASVYVKGAGEASCQEDYDVEVGPSTSSPSTSGCGAARRTPPRRFSAVTAAGRRASATRTPLRAQPDVLALLATSIEAAAP